MTKPEELQPETIDQSSQTDGLVDSETREEFSPTSSEPLMKIQPVSQKTLKNHKKGFENHKETLFTLQT